MGFLRVNDLVDAELNGQTTIHTWRKQPTQTTGAGVWFDLSMSPGNPVPQYYAAAPLVSTALSRSVNGGLDHGPSVSPSIKTMRKLLIMSTTAAATPMSLQVLDYLLYYPFIDESAPGEQDLTNSVSIPRYTSGAGVQMMAVVVGAQTGGQSFYVSYTNQNGVSGQITPSVTMTAQNSTGTIITTDRAINGCAGPFIPLQAGDTGVQSIQYVYMNTVDVGLMTIVLVKPIAHLSLRGIDAPVEIDYVKDFFTSPVIVDDAYLNFICCPNGNISGAPIHGYVQTVFN